MDFKTDLLEHEFFRTVLMLSQLKGWQRGLTNNSLQVRHLKKPYTVQYNRQTHWETILLYDIRIPIMI